MMTAGTCQDYCCSASANYLEAAPTKFPDLDNDIHPLFRQSNFRGISQAWYDLLKPSLQLASLLIHPDALISWILTTVYDELRTGNDIPVSVSQLFHTN